MIKYIIKAYTRCGSYVQISSPKNNINDTHIIKKWFRHEKLCPNCANKRKQLEEERKLNSKIKVETKAQCGKILSAENPYTEDRSLIRKLENSVIWDCFQHEKSCNQCKRMRKLKHLNYL